MIRRNFKRTLPVSLLFIALCGAIRPMPVKADMQDQMDRLFDDMMSNVTTPGAFKTQRRGVLSGGGVFARSKIIDENLVTLTPPSWKAGCGGVDLFGGSMSFINSDQIVNVLRGVAANAKGYAFQIAMDAVSPEIATWIENFQKKIQSLNQYFGNSCQMAQGVVNDLTSAAGFKTNNDASLIDAISGISDDFFAAKTEDDPVATLERNKPDQAKKLQGNIVWKQINNNAVASWFVAGGDRDMLEAMMSLTGTVIIGTSPSRKGGDTAAPIETLPGNMIALADLVSGSKSVKVYACDTTDADGCLHPGTKTISITGLAKKISDMLLGRGTNPGIIAKFAANRGKMSAAEKAFMESLPESAGALVKNLSSIAPDSAIVFASEASKTIALIMADDLAEKLIAATRQALANSESAYVAQATQVIDRSADRIRSEYRKEAAIYGDFSNLVARYNQILSVELANRINRSPEHREQTGTNDDKGKP